jgi:hypothetical protein
MLDLLRQFVCGLFGHHYLTQHDDNRLFERCSYCERERPGWQLDCAPPIPRYAGDPAHHLIARKQEELRI